MATLRNKKKLAPVNKENCEEHLRSNLAQTSNVPRSQEDITTHVSEHIEGRVTNKLSQELSRTENCISGALPRLDDFLMNPLFQGHSGTAPETSRNAFSTSQGANEDDSQSDPHPEVGIFYNQTAQNSGPKDGQDTIAPKNLARIEFFVRILQVFFNLQETCKILPEKFFQSTRVYHCLFLLLNPFSYEHKMTLYCLQASFNFCRSFNAKSGVECYPQPVIVFPNKNFPS